MIQKAYIEKQIDGYSYKVRIPRYNKSNSSSSKTPTEQLYTAYACQLPDIDPYYANGDVVWVDFENDDTSRPVILGKAFNGEDTQSHSEITIDSEATSTSASTNLSAYIEGITDNIQNIIYTHVGQVIMSTTLNTEAKVKQYYGGNTWKKINGSPLLGVSLTGSTDSGLSHEIYVWERTA